ncbi:hypothetical protein DFA_05344 [Cavenderia fasciculata]|uniref:PH domain-containing protein n=1 Tax=Cavenderia fasciculata TaxID=261658 RepID=F4PKZ0_CACFS|nr:uncharacterized protein DFA_05344 [Cavenderia fasciculata]EGG23212.1 hypothetical protein DFA_05344 [Cavenderia fasciculata]|eukprot:XP_004361063.1 hypothetical protein DFA_05344 [Cavenderia fasciculata]
MYMSLFHPFIPINPTTTTTTVSRSTNLLADQKYMMRSSSSESNLNLKQQLNKSTSSSSLISLLIKRRLEVEEKEEKESIKHHQQQEEENASNKIIKKQKRHQDNNHHSSSSSNINNSRSKSASTLPNFSTLSFDSPKKSSSQLEIDWNPINFKQNHPDKDKVKEKFSIGKLVTLTKKNKDKKKQQHQQQQKDNKMMKSSSLPVVNTTTVSASGNGGNNDENIVGNGNGASPAIPTTATTPSKKNNGNFMSHFLGRKKSATAHTSSENLSKFQQQQQQQPLHHASTGNLHSLLNQSQNNHNHNNNNSNNNLSVKVGSKIDSTTNQTTTTTTTTTTPISNTNGNNNNSNNNNIMIGGTFGKRLSSSNLLSNVPPPPSTTNTSPATSSNTVNTRPIVKSPSSSAVSPASSTSRSSSISLSASTNSDSSQLSECEELLIKGGIAPPASASASKQRTPSKNNLTLKEKEKLLDELNNSTTTLGNIKFDINGSGSSNSLNGEPIVIVSRPSDDKTWLVPDDIDIDEIKTRSIEYIEYILAKLSEHQKNLNSHPNGNTSIYQLDDLMQLESFEKKCRIRHDIAVMLEIIKQFNIGFDLIDMEIDFDLGDEMERKTFLLAKKVLYLKMEVKKSFTKKRANILFTIIHCIFQFLQASIIPKEVPTIPLEMSITMGNGSGLHPHIGSIVYKRGYLNKKKGRSLGTKFSTKWVILTHSHLLIYNNDKEEELLHKKSLSDLTSIQLTPLTKEGYQNCFTVSFVYTKNETSPSSSGGASADRDESANMMMMDVDDWNVSSSNLHMAAASSKQKKVKSFVFTTTSDSPNEEMIEWMLSIDGVIHSNFKSLMDLSIKEQFLSSFKAATKFRGGLFKHRDEEWHYSGDGRLVNENLDGQRIEYTWDGCTLSPDNKDSTLGRGRWNGVFLAWYGGVGGTDREPYLKYLYQPIERNYIVDSYPVRQQFTWTWSRHFLVSSGGGAGEWLIEGDVPPCLVMLVQMMKYYKLGR